VSSLETAKTAKKAKVVKFDPRLNEDRKFGCLFLPFLPFLSLPSTQIDFSLKSERQKWITLN
jgi:hypothetical protein